MNYEPNTIDWKVGDEVIHDADRKCADMLMVVLKVQKNGLILTRYKYPDRASNRRYKNEKFCLHDPARFGIVDVPPSHENGVKT